MIAVCTDSNAQLPPSLIDRYSIEVVPLTVTVDGRDYLEGVDLDADGFYEFFAEGRQPSVATAAPSPGRFGVAYQRLAERGASAILSVHIGSELSGTLNAAQVAASTAPVPVRLVDSHAASFIIGCAVWEAAEALATGATLEQAATRAETVAGACGNVFVVGTLVFARAGGRLGGDPAVVVGVPVLRLDDGKLETVGQAATADDAAVLLADTVTQAGTGLRVGIADSDPSSVPVADHLARRLEPSPNVREIIRYRVGPSVGVHTGPGTAGAVFYPTA
ncbi:MAG: DegV family protein [Acidimicrobiales bacterium]